MAETLTQNPQEAYQGLMEQMRSSGKGTEGRTESPEQLSQMFNSSRSPKEAKNSIKPTGGFESLTNPDRSIGDTLSGVLGGNKPESQEQQNPEAGTDPQMPNVIGGIQKSIGDLVNGLSHPTKMMHDLAEGLTNSFQQGLNKIRGFFGSLGKKRNK